MSYRDELYSRYHSTFTLRGSAQSERQRSRSNPLHPFRNWLPPNRDATIIDIGCGSGELLLALKEAGYTNSIGIDIGPEQIVIAKARGLNVERADAVCYLSDHSASFELMIACDVLEHLTRDEAFAFLSAARKAGVPGADLLLRLPNAAAPRGNVYQSGDLTHETAYSPGSLKQLCDNIGATSVTLGEDFAPPNSVTHVVRWVLWKGIRCIYQNSRRG